MTTIAKVRILALNLIYFFFIIDLSSQTTNENPLIKCMYGNQREYKIFKGEKLLIKLKTDKSKSSTKVDKKKIFTLKNMNNTLLQLEDSESKSQFYSRDEIYSIQRVEQKNKSEKDSGSKGLAIAGAISLGVALLFGLLGRKEESNIIDDAGNSCLAVFGSLFFGIIGAILLLVGLAVKPSSKLDYSLIDNELVFEDPECKCEYYTLP